MRLIDADVLLEKVQEIRKLALDRAVETPANMPFPLYQNPAYTRYSTQAGEREKFKTMIDEAPTVQPEQQWILCSERLPEDEYVLISKKSSKISGDKWCVAIAIRTADQRSRKIQWRDSGFGIIPDDKVLAWMPLPEPYQEGGEKE